VNIDKNTYNDPKTLKNMHDYLSMDIDKLNGVLKDVAVKDVPKSQWAILQAKHNIDSMAAKMNTDQFEVLNQASKSNLRSLGGHN